MFLTKEPETEEERARQEAAARVFEIRRYEGGQPEVVIVIDDPRFFFRSLRFRKYAHKNDVWLVGKQRGPKVSLFLQRKIRELALRSIDAPAPVTVDPKLRPF